jgi:opacity protein-like surface antigen
MSLMKKYIVTLTLLVAALTVSAQEVIWKMTYDVGFPFSTTKEFTDHVSWRGLSLDFDRFVGDNLAVGMGFSWSTFVEKESDSDYQRDDILMHGTQVRYINNIPLTARLSWYQALDMMEIFGTLGVGTVWQEVRREIGTFAFTDSYWQFALTPEVGMIFPVGTTYVTAKVRYVMGFAADEAPDLSYMSLGLGLAW